MAEHEFSIRVRTESGDKIHYATSDGDTTNGVTNCGHEWYTVLLPGEVVAEEDFCSICQRSA